MAGFFGVGAELLTLAESSSIVAISATAQTGGRKTAELNMQMIVSRNYRDRSVAARRRSLLEVLEGKPKITGSVASRWLMRGSEQLIRDASPLDHIVATDVKFVDAPKGEDGFGCRVVALCNEAQCLDTPPDAKEAGEIRLKFDMLYGEFYAPDRRVVTGCKRLRLLPDASILALEPIYRETAKSVAA